MTLTSRRSPNSRKLLAGLRDTWLLLREFKWPLTSFILTLVGGGTLFHLLSQQSKTPTENLFEAVYLVLGLIFLQPNGSFPREWYLELFYFLMPLIGLIILSQGIAEFATMFFNRRQRGKEWELAVASTFRNHNILVGLGHLGFRVVANLHELGQDVVIIELNPSADLVTRAKEMGIPVLQSDASRDGALEAAGASKAKTIILCTQNDSLNLQVALKARKLNRTIHVVIRIFDEDFAKELQNQFKFTALSATQMAAPIFAASAAGVDMTPPISVDGKPLSMAHITVNSRSNLRNLSVADIEQDFDVSVVLLRHGDVSDFHPPSFSEINENSSLTVLGGPSEIAHLIKENQ